MDGFQRSEHPETVWDDDIAILCCFAAHYGHYYYLRIWCGMLIKCYGTVVVVLRNTSSIR